MGRGKVDENAIMFCFACLVIGFLLGYIVRGIIARKREYYNRRPSR